MQRLIRLGTIKRTSRLTRMTRSFIVGAIELVKNSQPGFEPNELANVKPQLSSSLLLV